MYLCYLNKFHSINYTHKTMFGFITNIFSLYIIYPEKPKHLKRIGRYRNDRFQRKTNI